MDKMSNIAVVNKMSNKCGYVDKISNVGIDIVDKVSNMAILDQMSSVAFKNRMTNVAVVDWNR